MSVGILVKALPPVGMGGNPREAIQIAEALCRSSMEATFFCFCSHELEFKHFNVVPIKAIPFLPHLQDVMSAPQVMLAILKAMRRIPLDILVAFGADSSEGIAAPLAANMMGRPCILRTTGNDVIVSAWKYPFLVTPSIYLSDIVTPISNYMLDLITRYLRWVDKSKLRIIPIAVDTEMFNSSVSGKKVRLEYSLSDEFTVLTVARLVKRKGVDYLLLAVHKLLREGHHIRLLVVGDGPERSLLMTLAGKLGIANRVSFVAYVPDEILVQYYAACDVFVLPSIVDSNGETEAFGKVLAEALACEKPVIGTDVGGIREIVLEGQTGLMVSQRSSEELADAILRLKSDPSMRRKMGMQGRRIVQDRYSIQKVMPQWINLIIELLSNRSRK